MDNESMGKFIAQLRKDNHMTQRQLAEELNITDKAVSKWERGLSCPDISLLSKLASVLGVTPGDLLSGKLTNENDLKNEDSITNALDYASNVVKNNSKNAMMISSTVFTILSIISIAVCLICDFAISDKLTWSLIVVSSVLFGWIILIPSIRRGRKGQIVSLLFLSILIIPYLLIMNKLIENADYILKIGIPVSIISAIYLWVLYIVIKTSSRGWIFTTTLSIIISLPVYIAINFYISRVLNQKIIQMPDIIILICIAATALGMLVFYFGQKKGNHKKYL